MENLIKELSQTQKQAAQAMLLNSVFLGGGDKPVEFVLHEAGTTTAEFSHWMEDGSFSAYLYRLIERYALSMAPVIWESLLQSAKEGDTKAIRLYFDLCERRRGESDGVAMFGTGTADAEVERIRKELFDE